MIDTQRRRGRPATFEREAALDAAVSLFWRHGYDGTSIAMLTEAMGVTAPTLYSAFVSKEALYCAALSRYQQQEAQANAQVLAESSSLYRLVAGFLRASAARFSAPDGGHGCMISIGSIQCGPDAQAAARATAAARADTLARFVAAFEAGKAKGEIPINADSEALARFYTAVIQGMAVQATDGANIDQLNALVEVALAAWPALPQA
jgi:TetR/AcrR family transcriptional regulator, copper-responsive repressor